MAIESLPLSAVRATLEKGRSPWSLLPPMTAIGLLFYYPLSLIVSQALTSNSGAWSIAVARRTLTSRLFRRALARTLEIALSSTAGCLLLGLALALVVSFVPFRGAALLARTVDAFLAFPSFLIALALTFLYGSAGIINAGLMALMHTSVAPLDFLYSPAGVILAEITFYTPFAMRPLLAGFATVRREQVEIASSLGAGPGRIVREIILPAAVPALLAGGSLCLLLTLNEFGIVLFISAKGVITLPMLIYEKAIQEFDYSAACVIALVDIALSLTLYALYRLLLARSRGGDAAAL